MRKSKLIIVLIVVCIVSLVSCATNSESENQTNSTIKQNDNIKITELVINNDVIVSDDFTFNTDTYLYNIKDVDTDNIKISAKSNLEGVTFTYSKTKSLKDGENNLEITATAKDNSSKTFNLIVYKYNKSGVIANDLYNKTMQLYWMSDKFFQYDYSQEVTPEGYNKLSLITNYNDIVNSSFTASGLKAFEKADKLCIYKSNDKVYGQTPQMGSNIYYLGTVLINKSADSNNAIYTARSYYCENEKANYKDCDFKIIKVNGNWLTDEFYLPN